MGNILKELKIVTIASGLVLAVIGSLQPAMETIDRIRSLSFWLSLRPSDRIGFGLDTWGMHSIIAAFGLLMVFLGMWWGRYQRACLLLTVFGILSVFANVGVFIELIGFHNLAPEMSMPVYMAKESVHLAPGVVGIFLSLWVRKRSTIANPDPETV